MKNVKRIFSLIVLIVLIGTEILTPISYAFDDVENNPDSTQSYVDDGDRFEVDSNLVVESEEQQFQPEENDEGVEEINVPDSVELVEKQGGDLYDEFEEGGDDAQNSFIEPEESYGDDDLNAEISTQNMADSKSDDELVSNEIEYPSEFLLDDSDDEKELIDIIKDMVDDAVPEAYIGLNQVELTGSAFYDGVTVNVVAPKRSFPEGTQLRISTIEEDEEIKEKENQLIQQVEEVTEKSKKVSFDITFYNPEEPEIELQPIEGQVVSVVFDYQNNKSFRKADEEENNLKLKVYHLEESEENEGEVVAQEVKQKREADGLEISIENSSDENVDDEENGKEEKSEYEILANEFSVYVLTVVENDQVEVFLDANGGELVENEDVTILDECDEPGMLCATINSQEGYIVLPDAFRENATFLGWIGGDLEQVMAGYSVQTSQADGNTYRAKYTCNHGYIENEGECVSMDLSDRGISYDAEAGTITVWGGGLKYTILDKNVGATHTGYGVTDADAWGAYFQWGNNYPFYWSDVADIKVGAVTTRYSLQSTEIPNYSSSTWIKSNPWFSNTLRNSAFGPDNLWGGVSDEGDRNSRQGPCPDGYHVPSESELSNLYIARKAYHNNEENTNGNLMIQDLYIPYQGGMIGNTLASSNFNTTAYLWTNSRGDNDNSRRFVIGASSISVNNASRYHGSPVRCFQNYDTSSNKVVTYVYEQLVQFKKDSCIHTDLSMFTEENKWKDFQISFGMDQGSLISRNGEDTFISSSHEVNPYPGFVFRYRSNNVSDFDFYNGSTNSHIYTSVSSANVVNIFRQGKYLIFNNNVVSDNIYGTNLFSEPITIGCSLAGDGAEQRFVQGILSDVKIKVVYDLDDVILPSPTKTDREFGGWYTTPDFQEGTKVESIQGIGDVVLYARWLCDNGDDELDSCGSVDDIADKTVVFNANGGVFENGESTKSQMVSYGATIGDAEIPTKDGDEFLGWVQNGSSMYFDLEGTVVYGDTTLYAVWKNADAYMQVGQKFNDSIKSLVDWKLNNISSFERADTMSDEIKNSSNTILISLVDSAPIYAWYDSSDGTVYYYSDSETIYLKGSAANMFKGWTNVRYIDTRGWNTSGVTNMSYMFNGCSSLTELNVSDFDTANVTNMSYMFNGCSSLTELDVSGFDTVNVTNMSYMFYGCGNLTELDVSDFITSKVINMQAMFQGCSSLTELDVSNFNTSKVTYMDYMFYGCSSLVELDVSNFNTSKVTSMQAMFQGCSDLTELDLSNFDTSNVGNMSYMFNGCSSLTELDVSNFNTSKVTNMSYMFQWCGDLESLDVTSFATPNVTNMMHMFEGCSSLTELDVSNFDTSKVNELSWIFHDCKNLTDLDLRTWNVSSVVYMGSMFQGCSNLKNIDVSTWETTRVVNIDNMFNGCSSLTELDLSNFDTSNVKLMNDMFNGCSSLTELDLSNFNTTNVTTMSYMFYGCSSLTELDLSNFNTSNVTTMGGMLNGCSGLIELNLSGWNFSKYGSKNLMSNLANGSMISLKKLDMTNTKHGTSMEGTFKGLGNVREIVLEGVDTTNVTTMSYMFQGCSSLTELDVSNFNTSKVTTMSYMFNGCSSLTELDLSNFNTTNVTTMSYMFYGCSSLTELDLSNFDTSKVTAMGSMLNGCSGLIELNLSGWNFSKYGSKNLMSNLANGSMISLKKLDMTNTKHGTSMEGTFKGLGNVREIVLEGVDTTNVTTMSYMFQGCSSLEKLDLSGFDTSKVTTMSYMFNGCSSLTELDLSNFNTTNVTTMSYMLNGCSGLIELNLSGWNFSKYGSKNLMSNLANGSMISLKKLDMTNTKHGTSMEGTFKGLGNVREIVLEGVDTTNVTTMTQMFRGCSSLEKLDLSGFDTSKVTTMSYMFNGCSSLTGLDLSNFNTSNVTNMANMFDGCSSLSTIYASSNFVTTKVTTSSDMFKGVTQIVGGNGTTYKSNKVDKTYAKIDNAPEILGYFTDPTSFEIRFCDLNENEVAIQRIGAGEYVVELSGGDFKYYTSPDMSESFDFDIPQYKYTKVYVNSIYKVNYDSTTNGGTTQLQQELVENGNNATLGLYTGYKDGWTFLGWNTDQDATESLESLEVTGNITVYAIYKKEAITLTGNFGLNGGGIGFVGEGETSCVLPAVYNKGVQDTTCNIYSPEIFIPEGSDRVFLGLNSDPSLTGNAGNVIYNNETHVSTVVLTQSTSGRTWYIISKYPAITMNVIFDMNGSDGMNLQDSCTIPEVYNTVQQDTLCSVVAPEVTTSTNTPNFVGWNSISDATENNSDYNIQDGTLVLKLENGTTQRWYAITKSDVIKKYVVYHVNGNSWNDGSVEILRDEVCQISPSYNGNPQESSCTNDSYLVQTFKANGTKTPLGWSVLNATGSDILYQGGQTVSLSLDQNLDLYAQSVVEGQEYSVLFSGNGAKLGNEKEDEISLMCKGLDSYNGEDESKSRKCKLVTPDIIREGYTILGYSQSPESMDKEGDYMQMGTEIEVSVNGAVMYAVTYRTLTTIFNKNGNLAQKNSGSSDSVTWNITKLCDIWNTYTECDIITPKIVPAVDKVVMGYSTSSTVYQNSVPEESSLSVSDSDIYYAWSQSSPGIKTAIYTIGVGIEEQNLPDVQCVPDIQYNGDEIVDECEVSLPQVTAKIGYGTPKWYIGNNEVSVDETMRVKINQDTQFIVKAEPNTNTKYEVNHRWQNVDDNEYSLHETVSMYGTTDTQTSAQPKSYDGFYYTGDIEQKNISGDGSTVIDIYYIRESYHLHVEDRDEVLVDTNMKFGENIPLLSDPSRVGYTFMGWDPEIPEAMPAENLTIVSKWVVNKYTITFDTDGGSEIDPIVEDYGTIIHVPNQPTKDGNHFLRWEPEIPETMPDQDLIIKAIWEEDRGNNYSGGGGGGGSEKYDEKDQHHSVGEWGDPIIYNKYNVVKKDSVVNKEMVMNQGKVSEDMLSVYEWARKNSITTKNTIETANPNGFVRRGHLAKMIVNYMINVQGKHIPYDVPYQCLHWNDDESLWNSDEIKDYATKACALGIMGVNMKNNQFKPNDVVSRAEFGTVLSRVLWGEKYNVSKASKDTPYYILHLSALKTEGIMMQIDNPMNVRELRKWIWLMLSRSSKIYKG